MISILVKAASRVLSAIAIPSRSGASPALAIGLRKTGDLPPDS
jgi:hypothetical protein